jgi:Bacterial archaeo-eukaryotic release factor family 10
MPTGLPAASVSRLPIPLLTVYVNTNPARTSSRALVPECVTWLKEKAKSLIEGVLPTERRIFQEQVDRVEDFLRNRKTHEKGLVIFAGPETWELKPLQLEVENALHWGRPATAQLFSIQNAHKTSCVVVVDRAGARFFQFSLGELTELGKKSFKIDFSQWKREDIGHLAHPGIKTTRGTQRDTFEHRVDAQYARLCRQTAEHVKNLCRQKGLLAILLVGSSRLTEPIKAEFPQDLLKHTMLIKEDFGRLTLSGLKNRLSGIISVWEEGGQWSP